MGRYDFAVLSRDLAGEGDIQVVAPRGALLARDLCAEEAGVEALTFFGVDESSHTRTFRISADGVVEPEKDLGLTGEDRYDLGAQCGQDFAGRVIKAEEFEEEDRLELVEGERTTVFESGYAANIGDITLTTQWLAFGLYNGGDEAEGKQFVYHRPTRQLYELPTWHWSPANTMRQRAGYLTFGHDPNPDDEDAYSRKIVIGKLHPPVN